MDIDVGKQKNHILGTNEFKQRTKNGITPSYFENSLEEIEKVGKSLIATGKFTLDNKNPNIAKEKVYTNNRLTSFVVNNLNGKTAKTNRVVIRYNKNKGWHMYPNYPLKRRNRKK